MSSHLSSKHNDIAAADESIIAIETTIARLQTQLIMMKKERNSLTPYIDFRTSSSPEFSSTRKHVL
jgi:hypothetical protein